MKPTYTAAAVSLLSLAMASQQLVPADLDQATAQKFLDCVKATGQQYHISVDGGYTTIVPSGLRSLDLAGTDKALDVCVDDFSGDLALKMAGSTQGLTQYFNATSSPLVTAHDLLQAGALSLASIPLPAINSLSARAPSPEAYYGAFPDLSTGCSHADYKQTHYNDCISTSSHYESIKVQNNSKSKKLKFTRWQHHDCNGSKGGDPETVTVPAGKTSACLEHISKKKPVPIYSYQGVLK